MKTCPFCGFVVHPNELHGVVDQVDNEAPTVACYPVVTIHHPRYLGTITSEDKA